MATELPKIAPITTQNRATNHNFRHISTTVGHHFKRGPPPLHSSQPGTPSTTMGHLQFCPDSSKLVKAVRELCGRFGPNKIDEILLIQTINSAFQTSRLTHLMLHSVTSLHEKEKKLTDDNRLLEEKLVLEVQFELAKLCLVLIMYKLVEVVLRREQDRQLALISSREPSISSISGWSTPISDDRNVTISGRSTPISDDWNVQLGSSSSSTVNETDWEGLLPPDYKDIISRSVNPVVYATMEDLYTGLCSSPILLDGGKMSFHIDKTTGMKCYMIGAGKVTANAYAWNLTPHAHSRFSRVGYLHLLDVDIRGKRGTQMLSLVDIRGKIETQMLSPKTRYAAYFVYRSEYHNSDLVPDLVPAKGIIKFVNLDEDHDAERRATTLHLQLEVVGKSQQIAVSRPDGWMEVQLGMFYNDLGDNGPVEARLLKQGKSLLRERKILLKQGKSYKLLVQGIEFRPATNAEKELGAKENVRNRRKGIFSKLRISS
ncbi:Hypothetical predicted protein [Olea europaea subsp. europaea]|uniref:Uncharacterized protein n=1 Tax=Olea europaea subsp. europaea TaxID=158383 RepID=A0A8S0QRD1_OLEEU|nr:Hypothetical predicted protein [Olea europaea subsp. europaea]